MKKTKLVAIILSILATALLLGVVVMQYQPFWSVDDETVSITDYVWLTKEHKDVTKHFKSYMKDNYDIKYSTNDIATMPVALLLCAAVSLVVCVLKPGAWPHPLLVAGAGGYGAWGFLSQPLFQLGANWQMHLALCIAAAVVGTVGFGFSAAVAIKNKK